MYNSTCSYSGSVVLDAFYGYRVTSANDETLELIDKALLGVTGVDAPGAGLVDFFPSSMSYVTSSLRQH